MNNETTIAPVPLNPNKDALKAVLLITLFVITFLACIVSCYFKV